MLSKAKKLIILQYVAGITASITAIGFGCVASWSSPALSYLTSAKSHLPITKQQSDLTAAMLPVGFILGYILNTIIIDRLGRKYTLLIFSIPQIISWITIILAKHIMTIYIARVIGGIGYAGGTAALTIYLSEIGSHKNRGIFLILALLFINVGILYTFLLGAYLPYDIMNYFLLALPIIFAVTFFFIPDSSYFYEQNNNCNEEKRKGLMNLQESEEEERNESSVSSGLKINRRNNENTNKSRLNIKDSGLWKLLSFPSNRRALLITNLIAFIIVFSGNIPLVYFNQQIFTYSGSNFSPQISAIIVGGVKVFASLVSTIVIERVRRTTILLYTGIIGTIATLLVGIFLILDENNIDVSFVRWIPLFGVMLYDFFIIVGGSNLFYIYTGELFTQDVKSFGVGFSKIFLMALTFLALFRFQEIVDSWGIYTVFFIFSLCNAIGTFIVYVITPETKGKRLNEIQDLLKAKCN